MINVSGNKIRIVVKDINQASRMADILGGLPATATKLKAKKAAQKAASTPEATSTDTSTVLKTAPSATSSASTNTSGLPSTKGSWNVGNALPFWAGSLTAQPTASNAVWLNN